MTTISVFDLTVKQTEKIEKEVGLPMSKWNNAPSLAVLLTSILAAVEGKERSEYEDLTVRELMDKVDLGSDSPN